jgi:hypothetical protein
VGLDAGGKGEGSEEPEVRAGALRRPRGSLRRFARRRTEPVAGAVSRGSRWRDLGG